jgi:hypothetical protein
MGKIDTAGTYVGEILESSLGITKKGFPQWVARLRADQKWVDDAEGLKHFGLTEPGYVDWTEFGEDIVAFMVLFNHAEAFTADTKLKNYDQLQAATDWDGTEFDSLNDEAFVGKKILFRVEENTYEGKTRLQVNWIDAPDAPAERTLKKIDAGEVKSLNAKLGFAKKPKPAKAPATAAKAPTTPVANPASTTKPTATATAAPAKAPATPPKAPAKTPKAPEPETESLATIATKDQAWGYVIGHKGDLSEAEIADAWLSACQEVGNDTEESDFTPEMWAKVRDTVIKDADLK